MFIGTKNNNQEKNIMFTICRWVIIMNKGNYGSQYVMLGSVCGIVIMKEFIYYQKSLRMFEKMDIFTCIYINYHVTIFDRNVVSLINRIQRIVFIIKC